MTFTRALLALFGLLIAGTVAAGTTMSLRVSSYTVGYDGYAQFYNGAACNSSPSGGAVSASSAAAACAAKAKAIRDAESSDPCYSYTSSITTLACPTGYSGSPYYYYDVCNITTGTPASSSTTCRSSAGVCDPAEKCTGTSTACPANALSSSTTVCRNSAGVCDPAEYCTGSSATCPGDARSPAGTVCRAGSGACNPQEVCSGSSVNCPSDVRYSGTDCNGQCVNTSTDNANCGACGRQCNGNTCCSGACVNTYGNDANNCGACGRSCTASCSGTRFCSSGTCNSVSDYQYTVVNKSDRCFVRAPTFKAANSSEATTCAANEYPSSYYQVYSGGNVQQYKYCSRCWSAGLQKYQYYQTWPFGVNSSDTLACAWSLYPNCDQPFAGACP